MSRRCRPLPVYAGARGAFLAALLLSVIPVTARAEKSIFDDDYWESEPVPTAKPTTRPAPAAVAPPPAPTPNPATPKPISPPPPTPRPQAPVAPTPPPPPQPAVVVRKLRVPTLEQQAAGEKSVRDAFAPQLADKTRTGRRYVSDLLVFKSQAEGDATKRYAMLVLARDLASDAGDVRRALHAVDAMETAYHVNGSKMRVDAFVRAKSRFADPLDHSAAVTEGLRLMEQLSAVAQYRQLPLLTPVIRQSALKSEDKALAAGVKQATLDAEALAAEFDKAKAAAEVLKQKPDDLAANLAVGRFLCLLRDDWKSGLPKLLKASGTDPLYLLAVQETTGTIKSPAQRKQLAEGWWAYAESIARTSPLLQKRAQSRACAWYGTILESLSGLEKVTAEKRIAEARANGVDVDATPSDFTRANPTVE